MPVFASQPAAVAAQRLYKATQQLEGGAVAHMMQADHAIEVYRRFVQRDFGSPRPVFPLGSDNDPSWASIANGYKGEAPPATGP